MAVTRREFLKDAAAVCGAVAAGIAFARPTEASSGSIRPPGALPEDEFLARCIKCGRCADACPNRCIISLTKETGSPFSISPGRGEEGTPVIIPRRKACNLCIGREGPTLPCTSVCPTGALRRIEKTAEGIQTGVSMGKASLDVNLCYSYNGGSCGVCVRACPFAGKALRAGIFERPILDPAFCVGCGLCERACIRYPQAITVLPVARN